MSITPALERLAQLARQAEGKARAQKLGVEVQQAADRLKVVEARAAAVERRVREERPAHSRELEQANAGEQQLNDQIKKIAMFKSHLESDEDVEALVEQARDELKRQRESARAAIDEIDRETKESRVELKAALDKYQQIRRELDQFQPQQAPEFAEVDRLARQAETYFPEVHVSSFVREIEERAGGFGLLDRREQYTQMMVWIGRLRRFQAAGPPAEEAEVLEQTFRRLVGLSKQYEPGYIEAFQAGFTADWDLYVASAREQLRLAAENSRRDKDVERSRHERLSRDQERQRVARESAQTAMEELKGVIARFHLPEEGVEEFHSALNQVVSGYGTSDPHLLELIRPFQDLLTGAEFRALRRNLERTRPEDPKDDVSFRDQFRDILELTQGRKALMIGGSAREDMRRTLQHVFEFEELDWEPYEGVRPAKLDSIEQRVRNQGVDLILILKSFIGHHVPERLRPLCQQHGIPCLMIEHGYGPSQVAEALRRGLLKTA